MPKHVQIGNFHVNDKYAFFKTGSSLLIQIGPDVKKIYLINEKTKHCANLIFFEIS
jgi:hypothetical protein